MHANLQFRNIFHHLFSIVRQINKHEIWSLRLICWTHWLLSGCSQWSLISDFVPLHCLFILFWKAEVIYGVFKTVSNSKTWHRRSQIMCRKLRRKAGTDQWPNFLPLDTASGGQLLWHGWWNPSLGTSESSTHWGDDADPKCIQSAHLNRDYTECWPLLKSLQLTLF